MGRIKTLWLLASLLVATQASAQGNPTGTVSGRVTGQDGAAMPGATVSAASPSLQGVRSVVTTSVGDYIIPFLPPGQYTLRFELQGFQPAEQKTLVTAAGTVTLDAKLQIAGVVEAVTVTGSVADAFAAGVSAATTYKQERIDDLPLNRGIEATTALTPGVLRTGPSNAGIPEISISGGISSENLVLVNGVVAQDNVRRSALPVYIEDSLQETTITTSGVSAEFGRFSGGVINAITKSGGNRFDGTFRTNLANDTWRALTPFPGDTTSDTIVPVYEYTLGGPVLRDRLWFFTAGRYQNETVTDQLFRPVLTPYERTTLRRRFEGKGTYSPLQGHNLRVGYLNNYSRAENENFLGNELDLASLTAREDPENTWSFNYNAVLRPTLFFEAQYSQHNSSIVGAGSQFTDLIQGTLVTDRLNGARYNAPTFCGVCRPEERNNESLVLKGTYYLSRAGLGSHTIVGGYDGFNDQQAADNHQSGSDFRILGTSSIVRDGVVYPLWNNVGNSTLIQWNPILNPTRGTNFKTHSLFLNDNWRVNPKLTLNLGLRYDLNDGTNSSGTKDVSDAKISPRLGLTFDPKGNGNWILNGSYATYVSSLVNDIGNANSSAGSPATYQFQYLGPAINTNPNAASLTTTADALATLFAWFNANGGTNRPNVGADVPGVNTRVAPGLASPSVDEVAGGVTKRLGPRALLRVDGVYRKYEDFYATRIDQSTGQIVNEIGDAFDVVVTENTNDVERQYAGLNLSGSWRPSDRTTINVAYTVSRTWGNIDGETSASGPVPTSILEYPEFRDPRWSFPVGDLTTDQRHKLRVIGTYTAPLGPAGSLTFGGIQAFNTGNPYGAAENITIEPYVPQGLPYVGAPAEVPYYFTPPDAFRTERSFSTDLSAHYRFRLPRSGNTDAFVKADVLNVFNRHAVVNSQYLNLAVPTNVSAPGTYAAFNPFTATPVQGTNWDLGPSFGDPSSRFAYQTPRTFRMSFGVRF
ncbi:MAG: carboxypeptidase regulatory-like domain-containing protein [Vicinamibacterales bacterium]